MKESKSWCPSCSEGGCIWRDYVTQHPPNSLSFGNLVWLSRKWITTKLTRCNLKPRWNCGDLGPVLVSSGLLIGSGFGSKNQAWQVYMSQYPSRNLTQDPISRIGPRLNLRKTKVECTQAGGFRPFATHLQLSKWKATVHAARNKALCQWLSIRVLYHYAHCV